MFGALVTDAERDGLSVPFTALRGLTIAATAQLVTARPRFSAWLAMAMLSLSAVASAQKFPHLAINAHVVSLRFYLTNADVVTYLRRANSDGRAAAFPIRHDHGGSPAL